MKRLLVIAFSMAFSMACATTQNRITQDELTLKTQALFDAVAPGDKAPWQSTLAEDAMYTDELGKSMSKKELLDSMHALPKGYSGNIKVVNGKSHIEGNVAIFSYDMDETETIFGQGLTARYHATDIWMYRGGVWQIAAGQVLRYYEDPAAGKGDVSKYQTYAGTYELAPGSQATVSVEDGKLFLTRNGKQDELIPEAGEVFFRKGVEGRRLFHTGPDGKIDSMIDRRNNEDVVWKKIGP
jgi:Domain of unknown function (DUF4440)/Domain of unknown function (DUF3471)